MRALTAMALLVFAGIGVAAGAAAAGTAVDAEHLRPRAPSNAGAGQRFGGRPGQVTGSSGGGETALREETTQ